MSTTLHAMPAAAKPGRRKVDTEALTIRMHRGLLRLIDEWRRDQPDLPSRTESMRRLLASHPEIRDLLMDKRDKREPG